MLEGGGYFHSATFSFNVLGFVVYACVRYVNDTFALRCVLHMQVSVVVLSWASEHYSDFETVPDMEDFLDWFEQRLLEDVRKLS